MHFGYPKDNEITPLEYTTSLFRLFQLTLITDSGYYSIQNETDKVEELVKIDVMALEELNEEAYAIYLDELFLKNDSIVRWDDYIDSLTFFRENEGRYNALYNHSHVLNNDSIYCAIVSDTLYLESQLWGISKFVKIR